jgi:hypothetical protein
MISFGHDVDVVVFASFKMKGATGETTSCHVTPQRNLLVQLHFGLIQVEPGYLILTL